MLLQIFGGFTMGLGGISIWQLLIVLLITVMLFGTKRLKSLGGDLGGAFKGFKKAISEPDDMPKSDNMPSASTKEQQASMISADKAKS